MSSESFQILEALSHQEEDFFEKNGEIVLKQLGGLQSVLQCLVKVCKDKNIDTNQVVETLMDSSAVQNLDNIMKNSYLSDSSLRTAKSSSDSKAITLQKRQFRLIAYHFNDIIHLIIPKSKSYIADNIANFVLFSQYLSYISILCFVLYSIQVSSNVIYLSVNDIELTNKYIFFYILGICLDICTLFLSLLYLICYNLEIAISQLKTFDTMYKFANAILWCILIAYYCNNNTEKRWIVWDFINFCASIVVVSCIDGLYVKYNLRLLKIMIVLATIIFFVLISYVQYKNNHTLSYDRTINIFGNNINVESTVFNFEVNLVIFFTKQLYYLIRYPKFTTVVSVRPMIEWRRDYYLNSNSISDNNDGSDYIALKDFW